MLHHFSEDPTIQRFVPHFPRTNPDQRAAVWAIDSAHAPLYWFPRECPRITAWPSSAASVHAFRSQWRTEANRVHVLESSWLDRLLATELFRYDLPGAAFNPWPEAEGQWVAHVPVEPLSVAAVGDLLALHASSDIELRITPSLWAAWELAQAGPWSFSIVRMQNARPREAH